MGKTTMAASFPNPIVIRAEMVCRRYLQINVRRISCSCSEAQLMGATNYSHKEDHNYKTLIIDSVTALERLFMQSVIESDPKEA